MKHEVIVTRRAALDIDNAYLWWSENRSQDQAARWYDEIYQSISTLTKNPDRCPLASETDLLETGIRQLNFGIGRKPTHRIVFAITGQNVVILRVRHVAQDELTTDELS